MLRLGAALPLHNLAPGQQVAYIQQAETSGYEGIWVPEVMGTDAFTVPGRRGAGDSSASAWGQVSCRSAPVLHDSGHDHCHPRRAFPADGPCSVSG